MSHCVHVCAYLHAHTYKQEIEKDRETEVKIWRCSAVPSQKLNTERSGGLNHDRKNANHKIKFMQQLMCLQACKRKEKTGRRDEGSWKEAEENENDKADQGGGHRHKKKVLGGIFPWLLHVTPVSLLLNDKHLLSKVLQISGCFRQISSLAQWCVYTSVVSTGIYYPATLNHRTHTQYITARYVHVHRRVFLRSAAQWQQFSWEVKTEEGKGWRKEVIFRGGGG